jgi:hypothetical protein
MSVREVWSLGKSWYLKVNLMVDEKRIKGEEVIPGYILHSEECWYFCRNLSRVFWPLKRPISLIIIILPHILEVLHDSPNLILIWDDLTDFICPHKFMLDLNSSAFSQAESSALIRFSGSYYRQLRLLRFFIKGMLTLSIKDLVDIDRLIEVPSSVIFEKF